MLNKKNLACSKFELSDLIVCIVVNGKKISKSHSDLNLNLTMPIIELVRDIFITYNVFQFDVPTSRLITFLVIMHTQTDKQTDRHTHTHTHGCTYTHRDSGKYSLVVFCKSPPVRHDIWTELHVRL